MTEAALAEALRAAVPEVLEKMFFMAGLEESDASGVEDGIGVLLEFRGQPSGVLTLAVAGPAAHSIAADFLGAEEADLLDREIGEVICELANMICGSVLSRVESTTSFRLAAPRLVSVGAGPEDGGSPGECPCAASCGVEIPKGRLVASIRTETKECTQAEEYAF